MSRANGAACGDVSCIMKLSPFSGPYIVSAIRGNVHVNMHVHVQKNTHVSGVRGSNSVGESIVLKLSPLFGPCVAIATRATMRTNFLD